MSIISLINGAFGYENSILLSDVNLAIKIGELWAFVGTSGSGKSTLLNLIAGNVALKKGQLIRTFHSNKDTHQQSNVRSNVAFVPQRHHFRTLFNTSDFYYQQRYNSFDSDDALSVSKYLESITVSENLSGYWNVDKVIDLMKLTPLIQKKIIKLSNGETKRLMIAAALLKNPQLLLMDNPMAGLDIQTRADFNDILSKIYASGITVVITANAQDVPDVITNIAVLDNGKVQTFLKADFLTSEDDRQPITETGLAELFDNYPAPAFQEILTMKNVCVIYESKRILNNINWHIKQGERWALLGPNGAGKSTLLSLINGDNPQAYANDIILFDKKRGSGESIWDIKKKTGFISPELFQFFPREISALQAIESGYYDTMGLFRPVERIKTERALQWMQLLEIERYSHMLLKNVPAAAQRLCLLARVMIKCPALLILDEPCQGLDDHQVSHFKMIIDTICKQTNITLIYVTHYPDQIPKTVTKTLYLKDGAVVHD